MLLRFPTGKIFASGATIYDYTPATEREDTPRITLEVMINDIRTSAFVDTGSVYLFCPPQIAENLNLDPSGAWPAPRLLVRGVLWSGMLHRVRLTFIASEGEIIAIEATAFVAARSSDMTEAPCILGMYNCLDRLRFAVDPGNDVFYFGELG